MNDIAHEIFPIELVRERMKYNRSADEKVAELYDDLNQKYIDQYQARYKKYLITAAVLIIIFYVLFLLGWLGQFTLSIRRILIISSFVFFVGALIAFFMGMQANSALRKVGQKDYPPYQRFKERFEVENKFDVKISEIQAETLETVQSYEFYEANSLVPQQYQNSASLDALELLLNSGQAKTLEHAIFLFEKQKLKQ